MGLISLLLSLVIIAFGAVYFFNDSSQQVGDTYLEKRLNTEKTVEDMVTEAVPDYISKKSSQEKTSNGKILDLSNQNLKKVPESIFSKNELVNLNLSHNSLNGALPAEIRLLSHLKVLNLSHNNFTGVPAEIGQLSELEVLNLSYNPITGLPLELGNLKKLKTLDLRGTDYSKFDLDKIKEALGNEVNILVD